mgnify:CR=1 FL=1
MTRARGLCWYWRWRQWLRHSTAFRNGEKAEHRHEFDRAVLEYSRALTLDPENTEYQQALERARLRAAEQHAFAARSSPRGQHKEASDEIRLALDLAPNSPTYLADLKAIDERRLPGGSPTTMQEIKERARERSLPGLVLGPEARQPLGLVVPQREPAGGLPRAGQGRRRELRVRPSFQDQTISVDLPRCRSSRR